MWDEARDFYVSRVNEFRSLVKHHRSHPSIVVWGFCNEQECYPELNASPDGPNATVIAFKGEVAVPDWLQGLCVRMDMTVEAMAKLLVGVSLAMASAITILGTRGRLLAALAGIAITFSGVADLAAWFSLEERGTILWPLLQLITGLTSVVLWQSSAKTEASPQRHPALRFTLIAVGVIISSIISAQINIKPVPKPAPRIDQTDIARDEEGRLRVNNFYPDNW